MAKKSVKLYTPENVIDAFYRAIRTNTLHNIHIPHSSVFYVRAAIEAKHGKLFSLSDVERAMKAEGMLDK